MTIADKQRRILPLFKRLTSLSPDRLPEEQWDPRLHHIVHLHRGELFSCFHEGHLHEAEDLYKVLYEAQPFDNFIALAANARDIVNEGLFAFALSVAVSHREDCHGVVLPPIKEVFPDKFVPAETITKALKVDKQKDPNKDTVIVAGKTGNVKDPEYKLAYFREDMAVNSHHWHWHIVYPATYDKNFFNKLKDRKGELFFYMHQQMCARYDCERLSVGLQRVTPFHDLREEMEACFPHLNSMIDGLNYSNRPAGMSLKDVPECSVLEMERWRERILDAIHTGHVTDHHGKEIPLTEENGLDILGALIESSRDSVNKGFYGTLHNWGHVMIAHVHDPDGKYKTNAGVMDDTSTSLRDPIFYRYHRWMDNIFQEYKHRLHCYTRAQLSFPEVRIASVTVRSKVPNLIHTYTTDSMLELSHGIRLNGRIQVKYEHLDHEPFTFDILADNRSTETKEATVRIFLAPKYDELGNKLILEKLRGLCIELDKFHCTLAPGKNRVERKSEESSVTLSHVYTFDELEAGTARDPNEYCSCGWPEHMLVPRGNSDGMVFYLIVMLTDYHHDKIDGAPDEIICSDAVSYCGAVDQKYPDKKAMGYPFDRPIEVRTPSQFRTPNMSFTEIRIQYEGHKP